MADPTKEDAIRGVVRASVQSFAEGFKGRHVGESEDPDGTINSKINNVFMKALGPEIVYYSSLVRSFDSTLGNTIEKMAINIAEFSFDVNNEVSGPISKKQTHLISDLLSAYKNHIKKPEIGDYLELRNIELTDDEIEETKTHSSDYYLTDEETGENYLIELKIGGDLDNKKARSEKSALLEQYAILSNHLSGNEPIHLRFATAYNKYGTGNEWKQQRVRQFFADEELLIEKDFWNFICQREDGFEIVISEYKNSAHLIKDALAEIKNAYL